MFNNKKIFLTFYSLAIFAISSSSVFAMQSGTEKKKLSALAEETKSNGTLVNDLSSLRIIISNLEKDPFHPTLLKEAQTAISAFATRVNALNNENSLYFYFPGNSSQAVVEKSTSTAPNKVSNLKKSIDDFELFTH